MDNSFEDFKMKRWANNWKKYSYYFFLTISTWDLMNQDSRLGQVKNIWSKLTYLYLIEPIKIQFDFFIF